MAFLSLIQQILYAGKRFFFLLQFFIDIHVCSLCLSLAFREVNQFLYRYKTWTEPHLQDQGIYHYKKKGLIILSSVFNYVINRLTFCYSQHYLLLDSKKIAEKTK